MRDEEQRSKLRSTRSGLMAICCRLLLRRLHCYCPWLSRGVARLYIGFHEAALRRAELAPLLLRMRDEEQRSELRSTRSEAAIPYRLPLRRPHRYCPVVIAERSSALREAGFFLQDKKITGVPNDATTSAVCRPVRDRSSTGRPTTWRPTRSLPPSSSPAMPPRRCAVLRGP